MSMANQWIMNGLASLFVLGLGMSSYYASRHGFPSLGNHSKPTPAEQAILTLRTPTARPVTVQPPSPQQLDDPHPPSTLVRASPYHLHYEENTSQLVQVNVFYGQPVMLDHSAAAAFWLMKADAKKEGINLQAVSGYRSYADQKTLFERQVARRGSELEASRLSAPAGFSEHHTGYAIDISDADNEKDILSFDFNKSEAFRWLQANAGRYGFEMSFSENNPMGVSYEPWHWRFVGSPEAIKTFSVARRG